MSGSVIITCTITGAETTKDRQPALHWGVAEVGRFQLPLATQALVMGGHVRVGFEDNVYYRKGELAHSNAQLVARIARLAQELGIS